MAAKKFNSDDNYYKFDEAETEACQVVDDLQNVLAEDLTERLGKAVSDMSAAFLAAHQQLENEGTTAEELAYLKDDLKESEKDNTRLINANTKLAQELNVLKARLQLNGLSTSTKQSRRRQDDECEDY